MNGAATAVNDNDISAYLGYVKDDTPLKVNEERALLKKFSRGDMEARRRLIESNIRFVVKVALGYRGQGMSLSDLIQEGNLGLIEALGKFDASKGVRLITYASWWIRLHMQRSIEQKTRTVNLPINKLDSLKKIRSFEIAFEQQHARRPHHDEVSEQLGLDEKHVVYLRENSPSFSSLHSHDDDNVGLDRVLADTRIEQANDQIWKREVEDRIRRALRILTSREREVISWRFGLGSEGERCSLRQVGHKMGLSPEGVRRIEEQALNKLRRPYIARKMEQLLC